MPFPRHFLTRAFFYLFLFFSLFFISLLSTTFYQKIIVTSTGVFHVFTSLSNHTFYLERGVFESCKINDSTHDIEGTLKQTHELTIFTDTKMDLVYAQKFAYALSSISLGTSVIPRKHWKQRLRIFWGEGGGGIKRGAFWSW